MNPRHNTTRHSGEAPWATARRSQSVIAFLRRMPVLCNSHTGPPVSHRAAVLVIPEEWPPLGKESLCIAEILESPLMACVSFQLEFARDYLSAWRQVLSMPLQQ